jgi:predicted nuclease with RNAse H fold
MLLLGIDVATVEAKVGLAFGEYGGDRIVLREAVAGTRARPPAAIVCEWLRGAPGPVLLAIDAPLGWPRSLASSLAAHRAGQSIPTHPNDMFRRTTDRFIHQTMGKLPLDVGADRIARTAHAALKLLGEIRERLDAPIPLAWTPTPFTGIAAIEVYPAATLVAHGTLSSRYKRVSQKPERRRILRDLEGRIRIGSCAELLEEKPDVLDAAVCLVAAADFLSGRAIAPKHREIAVREGWIWSAPRAAPRTVLMEPESRSRSR